MTRPFHLLLAAALCAACPAGAASTMTGPFDPLNRPSPGATVTPNVSPDGSLGMAILGARVNIDASLIVAAGATSALHLEKGAYEVDFNRNVSSCIYSVSSFFPTKTTVEVEPRANNVNGVFIQFTDLSGAAIDAYFYLTVFCNS